MLFPELHRAGFLFLGSLITSAVDIVRFIFAACRSCCLCDVNHDVVVVFLGLPATAVKCHPAQVLLVLATGSVFDRAAG